MLRAYDFFQLLKDNLFNRETLIYIRFRFWIKFRKSTVKNTTKLENLTSKINVTIFVRGYRNVKSPDTVLY